MIRTLIAQSDAQTRAVLGWLLAEDERFEVAGAVGSGDEVIGWLEPVAAALIDLDLAGIDALQTVRALRDRHPRMTIVITAGVDAPYLRAAALDAGADGYINRVVDAERLCDVLAGLHGLQDPPP